MSPVKATKTVSVTNRMHRIALRPKLVSLHGRSLYLSNQAEMLKQKVAFFNLKR